MWWSGTIDTHSGLIVEDEIGTPVKINRLIGIRIEDNSKEVNDK